MDIDDALLTSAQVKRRYGDASDMTIWRWLKDEKFGFPKPTEIKGRRFWRLSDLQKFDAAREAHQTGVPDSHISHRRRRQREVAAA
jgi:predicted DNA-binding transcriptional regulator AlpA